MLGTRIPGSFTRPPLLPWAAAALLVARSPICPTADRAPVPREASSKAPREASRETAPGAHRLAQSDLAGSLELEAHFQALAAASPDLVEGMAAFREKRDAKFTGE